jgi:hypothetical protein
VVLAVEVWTGGLPVVAEVEVGGERVSQVLGGEAVQRCLGHGSCKRSDIVSLIENDKADSSERRNVGDFWAAD